LKMQYLSKKDVKAVIDELRKRICIDRVFIDFLEELEDDVKRVSGERFEILAFGAIPALFKTNRVELYIPTLYAVNVFYNTKKILVTPTVTVDEGAVNHLKNGADVMIPGIKKLSKPFSKGDIVSVFEPGEKYLITIGIALVDSATITPGARGKAIKNLHHIDDDIWRASMQIAKALQK
jgi:PUA-domain protein